MAVHSLSMPDLSVAIHNGDRTAAKRAYRASIGKGLLLLGPPMLFTAIFSDFHLFERLYGLSDVSDERVQDLLKEKLG